ncbi:lantibiotic dehydratase [Streptomonospora sp. NEAU-YY374]|nr:lantibiotic dehydratase [Streptomonospora nanhaiensis]
MRAIEVASPSLARTLLRADPPTKAKARRTAAALTRYLLRATGRPTPFGLFAGVAPVAIGSLTQVSWQDHHQEFAQPAPGWLAVHAGAASAEAGHATGVVAAQTVRVHGDRLVLAHTPHRDDPRKAGTVSLRHTPAVSLALGLARVPTTIGELRTALTCAFPGAGAAAVSDLLTTLLAHRILISAAPPPVWHPWPLSHLAEHAPALEPAAKALRHHNRSGTGHEERIRIRHRVNRELGAGDGQAVAVDTRLAVRVELHRQVAEEAARAAGVAARIAPKTADQTAWADYHRRCLDTYGQHALVGLLSLTGPAGLGLPASFPGSRLTAPAAHPDRDRERALAAAAAEAAAQGEVDLDLEAPAWRHLVGAEPDRVPAHTEVRAHLLSASAADVDAGRFQLFITGLSRGAGALTGRFAHLPGMVDPRLDTHLPTLTAGAVPVQVLAPPMAADASHVARSPIVASRVLVIDTYPPDQPGVEVMDIREVAVRIDPDHLRLVHTPTGAVLEPFCTSALDTRRYTHPLARFTAELPQGRTGLYPTNRPWPPTTASFAYLPRLRTGRSILTPAQWRLTPHTWPQARSRPHLPLPRRVLLLEGERGLPLDLAEPAQRVLVTDHLHRHGSAVITEAPDPDGFSWCGGHAHELVFPLGTTRPPTPCPNPPIASRARSAAAVDRSAWISAHLYTDPCLFTGVLAGLSGLDALLGGVPARTWFVRYRDDSGPHLRLRLRAPAEPDAVQAAVGEWARTLGEAELIHTWRLEPYRPERDRYGRGTAMRAAEDVFVADSRAALAQIQACGQDADRLRALAALSLLRVSAAMGAASDWLLTRLPRSSEPVDRPALARARALFTQAEMAPPHVDRAWQARDEALAAYRRHCQDPLTVLPSLWHMHHNRVHGPDRDDEHRLLALARSLTLSLRHLPGAAHAPR